MLEWEYVTRSYQFYGAAYDDWPGRERYAELLAEAERDRAQRRTQNDYLLTGIRNAGSELAPEGHEADRLADEYLDWRESIEPEYLNEFGAAGFELVSVSRTVERQANRQDYTFYFAFPRIQVFCYFKRLKVVDAPEPPKRTIGFQAR